MCSRCGRYEGNNIQDTNPRYYLKIKRRLVCVCVWGKIFSRSLDAAGNTFFFWRRPAYQWTFFFSFACSTVNVFLLLFSYLMASSQQKKKKKSREGCCCSSCYYLKRNSTLIYSYVKKKQKMEEEEEASAPPFFSSSSSRSSSSRIKGI